MNKIRKGNLQRIITEIRNNYDSLENLKLEEEFSYDNLPENLQCTFRAEESERIIDELDEILEDFDDVIERLSKVL